jgi:hypothetical protein
MNTHSDAVVVSLCVEIILRDFLDNVHDDRIRERRMWELYRHGLGLALSR